MISFKRLSVCVVVFCAFALFPKLNFAATLTGSLSGDETWSGEVLLSGDVTVPLGVTLTVEAGSAIKFQALSDDTFSGADASRSELRVDGNLIVEGTGGSPITFTSSATIPAKGDWGGIRMNGEGTLTLDHVVVE